MAENERPFPVVVAAVLWLRRFDVSDGAARVLTNLAEYFDAEGIAFPAIETQGVDVHGRPRTVSRTLSELLKHERAPIRQERRGPHLSALYVATADLWTVAAEVKAEQKTRQSRHVRTGRSEDLPIQTRLKRQPDRPDLAVRHANFGNAYKEEVPQEDSQEVPQVATPSAPPLEPVIVDITANTDNGNGAVNEAVIEGPTPRSSEPARVVQAELVALIPSRARKATKPSVFAPGESAEAADVWIRAYRGRPPAFYFKQVEDLVRAYGSWPRVRPVLELYFAENPDTTYLNIPKNVGGAFEALEERLPQGPRVRGVTPGSIAGQREDGRSWAQRRSAQ